MAESTLNSNPHGGAVTFSCQDFHPLQGLGTTTQDLQEPQIQQQIELNSWDPLLLSSRELTVKGKWIMLTFYPHLKHSVWIPVWNTLTNSSRGQSAGQDTYGFLWTWEKSAREHSHLRLFTAPKHTQYTQKQSVHLIGNFSKCFCVVLRNSMSGHKQTPHPTVAAAQDPRPAEMVPLEHPEWMEGGFCSWNIQVIKKQTHRAQSGWNSSAAPLSFVACARGWWEDERAGNRLTLYSVLLNPTFEKHLGNTPKSNEKSPLPKARRLISHTFTWAP